MTTILRKSGIVNLDMPEDTYHADPLRNTVPGGSLSSTEARTLLQAPALLRHRREHPAQPTAALAFGTAVHAIVLGTGRTPVPYPDEVLSPSGAATTAEARRWAREARDAGQVPMKRDAFVQARDAADAVLSHPVAGPLLEGGHSEVSVFHRDYGTGVWMRGRIDHVAADEVTLIDLKTTTGSADPSEFSRAAARWGYDIQRAWYTRIWSAVSFKPSSGVRFLHVVVEKTAPYLVSICEMDWVYADLGEAKADRALRLYRECVDSDRWPGIPGEVHRITPPAYYIDSDRED